MRRYIYLTLLIIVAAIEGISAKETTFTVTAPPQVIANRQFNVVYTLKNGSSNGFNSPNFQDLKVLYGPAKSVSSQYSIVNGKTESLSEEKYTFTLIADKEGDYTIPAAKITSDGKSYSTSAKSIKVLPPDKNAPQSNNANAAPQTQSRDDKTFSRLIISKSSVYEQEPLLVSIRLYTKASNISNITELKLPSYEGFVVQDIPIDKPQVELENYNGENYSVVTIKKSLLYPQHSGKIVIDPATVGATVQVIGTVQSFFGMRQGLTNVEKDTKTNSATINVKPLPGGAPSTFANAVGNLKISSTINTTTPKANEAITLKVVISGQGNLRYIKDPEVKFPADFEVYDPQTNLNVKNTTSGGSGSRTIEYTVIPRSAGSFTIPPVEFTFFNTSTNSYKTVSTQEYNIEVEKGADTGGGVVTNFTDKEALRVLNQDINYLKSGDLELKQGITTLYGTFKYWLYYIIPLLLFVAYIIVNRKQAQDAANITQTKNRRAKKIAHKRLKQVEIYLKSHKEREFYTELLQALWGYISDKLSIPVSELTRDNVALELQKYGVDEESSAKLIKILNECEFAQYAPSQAEGAMESIYKETIETISQMESYVKK